MRKFLLSLLLFGFIHTTLAQQPIVKGKVMDTLERKDLQNTVVSLLNKKDSILFKFTRTDKSGAFSFNNVIPGKYILLITYPKFADYADEVEIKAEPITDFGTVPLTLKAKLLDAVIIKSSGGIRIKGDTTEFVADSFHLKEGATVEDLLKKFPGFQVNSKGEITAQGKRVDKVLVDGEEFFGDDPTMATQNLSSKIVDKVQMFDTKTDEQKLTGINNESNTKTLNIKLKDEFKKGSFGKVEAASDFNRFHDGKILYNRFRSTQKFSFYATKSNTTAGGISWQDQNKFGLDNSDYQYDDVSGNAYWFSGPDEFSDWSLKGLPDAYTLGGVYINKWNSDKQSLNAFYKYNRLGTVNGSSTFTKSILPASVLYTQQSTNGHSLLQQYAPSVKYEWKLDSLNTITFKSNNTYKTNKTLAYTSSQTQTEDMTPLNNSSRVNNNSGTKTKSDDLLTYKKLFKKTGRQFTTSLHYTYAGNQEDNFIYSLNHYYTNGMLSSQDSTDQEKIVHSNSSTIGANISWTEPLKNSWSLIMLGSYNQNTTTSHLNTFNKSSNGKYEDFTPFYSNNFDYNASAAGGTIVAKYTTKKINFAAGTGLSKLTQNVHNIDSNVSSQYRFLKFLPQLQFRYSLKPQTSIAFRYNGSSKQPSIEQLQPIRNNNDPLNIFIGNPNLKIAFNHNFNLFYNSYQVLSQRYFYVSVNYNSVINAVTTASTIDANGRKVSTNINSSGNHNWNLWANWNKSHGEGKWSYGSYANANGGTSVTFINGIKSINQFAQYEIYLNFNKSKEDKYDFGFAPQFGQNFSSSSIQPDKKTHYITWGGEANGEVTIKKKFVLTTSLNAQLRQKISPTDNNTNVFLWNAKFARKLFKKDVAKISIVANDILDQNKGVNRIANSNFITDERYLQVSRYFQLKFEWSFNNNPGSK